MGNRFARSEVSHNVPILDRLNQREFAMAFARWWETGVRGSAFSLAVLVCAFGAQAFGAPPEKPAATKAKPAKKQVPKRDPIYNPKADATADIAAAVKKARFEHTRVLVMYGGNWCGWCYKLHDLFASDKEIAALLRNEYQLVMVDIDTQHKVMDHYVKKSEQHGVPFLTVLDSDGKILINQETGVLEDGPKHDPKKVKAFLSKWASPQADAEKVLADGLAEAKRDSKRVLFHVGAPWCGWCHVLDRFLAENESLFASDYINLKIDQDRMTNAAPLIKRFRESKSMGIPWIAILDADGKTLATSDMPKDGNTGYPGSPKEIRHFMEMVKKTKQRTTPEQLATIEKKLNEERERIESRRRSRAAVATPKRST
jgi:thiol:disulfide interchange protein